MVNLSLDLLVIVSVLVVLYFNGRNFLEASFKIVCFFFFGFSGIVNLFKHALTISRGVLNLLTFLTIYLLIIIVVAKHIHLLIITVTMEYISHTYICILPHQYNF
jgi:hypothetical protein